MWNGWKKAAIGLSALLAFVLPLIVVMAFVGRFGGVALAAALVTLALLDVIRGRLLVRAGARLDAILSPLLLRRARPHTGL